MLCKSVSSPALATAHISLLRSSANPQPIPNAKLLKLIRKYVGKYPDTESLWLSRLEVEAMSTDDVEDADWKKVRQEGIEHFRKVRGEVPEAIRLWEAPSP